MANKESDFTISNLFFFSSYSKNSNEPIIWSTWFYLIKLD